MAHSTHAAIILILLAVAHCIPVETEREGSRCDLDCCRTLSDRPPMTYTYYQRSGRFVGGSA
jgi:hypothetical protein